MRILMWEHFAPGGAIRVGGHHFSERFLRDGARIAWCVGPLSPVNFVKRNEETRARLDLWRRGGRCYADGMLFAYAPMTMLPYRPYRLFDGEAVYRRTLAATVPRWRRVMASAGFDKVDLLWMSPGAPLLALLDQMPHRRSVYRMSDDTSQFPDTPRTFARLEGEVCRRVDLVVATARSLEQRARDLGARRVLFLPNACEPERFRAGAGSEPPDIVALPRPRAVYAGAIDSWFDSALVGAVAARMPDWQFVLVGPRRAGIENLERLPNVVLAGARRYDDLPGYLGAADAGIVPFRLTPMTHAIHPIKVYEYFAAGLPVVATPMTETAAMQAPLRLAGDPASFESALRAGLEEGAAARAERLEFARSNSWDHRYATVRNELQALEGPVAVRRAGGEP
jgi:glycosyltransferase involved in cell wall biosynthesis